MTFDEKLAQVVELLQREGRVSYRALKRRFQLDDEYLEDLKAELIDAKERALDKDGKVLVWTGRGGDGETEKQETTSPDAQRPTRAAGPEAERRQLTVMFCDLVGSTALSEHLDPEELHEVVRAYQQTSAQVIERYDGHIAQYLGDGLLVYFGYPTAHEDDAARAIRTGLGIVEEIHTLNLRLVQPLQVRLGIHTGQVVVGEMGGGQRQEQLALGDTPNIAARVQGRAEPDSVIISGATYCLVRGLFECEHLGAQALKGLTTPLALYRVVGESEAQSRFDVAVRSGLTPLVGREPELGFLQAQWQKAQQGAGQAEAISPR